MEKVGANVRSSQNLVKDGDGDLGGKDEGGVKRAAKGDPPRQRYAILANKVDIVNFANLESGLMNQDRGVASGRNLGGVNKPVSVVPGNVQSPRGLTGGKRNSTLALSGRNLVQSPAPEPLDKSMSDKCRNPHLIPLESQGPNAPRRGTTTLTQTQTGRASAPNVDIDINDLQGSPISKSGGSKTRVVTQDTGAFKKTYQTVSGFGETTESPSLASSTRIEFQTMENFNYYVVANHFDKALTNCIKDVGTELYISIEFDVKKYVTRSIKKFSSLTPEIAEKDFGSFVGDLVKYLAKKFKYYKANYVYDNYEKQEDLTPLDMCKIVFGLEDNIIEPLKNPDFFLETSGIKFRSLWDDDKKFQEFLELLLTEWSNYDKFHDSTLKKWFKHITTDKTDEKMMTKLFLLIAY